jgi:hypothetical protein
LEFQKDIYNNQLDIIDSFGDLSLETKEILKGIIYEFMIDEPTREFVAPLLNEKRYEHVFDDERKEDIEKVFSKYGILLFNERSKERGH